MNVTENDLEILEQWLDGELADEHTDALRRRLADEPQLTQALDRLRADRQRRSQLWQAMEPADAEIDALVNRVRRSMVKEHVLGQRLRTFGHVARIAATVAIVFGAGWISRSRLVMNPTASADSPTAVATAVNPQQPPALNPNARLVDSTGLSTVRPTYKVVVYDRFGKPMHVQEMEQLADVRKFTEQMARFPSAQRRADAIVPVSETDRP